MRPSARPLALAFACLGLTLACQSPQSNTSAFTTNVMLSSATGGGDESGASGSTSSVMSSGPSAESTTTSDSAASSTPADSSGDPGLLLDVGTRQDAGTGAPAGCKGKIDFLFVVNRSAVNQLHQDQLVAAFPAFIETIETKFADFDYHIMVVDGDDWWGSPKCDDKCPTQCAPGYPCDYTPTFCDTLMGAGTVFPAGVSAANKSCGIAGGRRYMVKGQPDLKETFACVGKIGSSGAGLLGNALTAAVDHTLNGPGGCNQGFLRKDALLMLTLLTTNYDEVDQGWASDGTPESWHAAVLNAKGNDPEAMVVLTILDSDYAPGCHPLDRLCQMTRMFQYSLVADILDKEYGVAFDAAAAMIGTACDGYTPPS